MRLVADDQRVIDFARSERRLLLTEDKDFGQLVFAAAKQHSGVILIRYPASARSALSAHRCSAQAPLRQRRESLQPFCCS